MRRKGVNRIKSVELRFAQASDLRVWSVGLLDGAWLFLDCLTLKKTVLRSFETSKTTLNDTASYAIRQYSAALVPELFKSRAL
jgi:hypothetical protein